MSMSQVTKSVGLPALRFRATVSAFRKTSGMMTALPQLSTTPPPCRVSMLAASRRKSRWLVSPMAAPSAAGCWWMISAPSAACTVTPTPSRWACRMMLSSGCARSGTASSARATLSPMPQPFFMPAVKASLSPRPVSSAMPKLPSRRPTATSSLVAPNRAIS